MKEKKEETNNRQFVKNDEGFICENCGREVNPLGYTSRNHCPHCLWSLHVDVLPGDRANDCGGLLEPIAVENNKKGTVIVYQCKGCGQISKNIAAEDDDYNQIVKVSNSPKHFDRPKKV